MEEFVNRSATVVREIEGGHTTLSMPSIKSNPGFIASARAPADAIVVFIFQFPAMSSLVVNEMTSLGELDANSNATRCTIGAGGTYGYTDCAITARSESMEP